MYLLDTDVISELRKAGSGRADEGLIGDRPPFPFSLFARCPNQLGVCGRESGSMASRSPRALATLLMVEKAGLPSPESAL